MKFGKAGAIACVAILVALGVITFAAPSFRDRTIVVTGDDLADCGSGPSAPTCKDAHKKRVWFFYNDSNDSIDNTIGSFVYDQYGRGPFYDGCGAPSATCQSPPLGAGSAQISTVLSRRPNLATYQFGGIKLSTITTLRYSTYNPLAGNGQSLAGFNRSGYLQFNVDFIGNSTTWQRRLTYVPKNNGVVIQNFWQEWDAINSGNANWTYSGPTWPAGVGVCATPGGTPKTWNQILACYPNSRILPGDSFLGIRVGEPYADGYTENIDAFKLGTAAGTTTFDFEPGGRKGHDDDHGHDDDDN